GEPRGVAAAIGAVAFDRVEERVDECLLRRLDAGIARVGGGARIAELLPVLRVGARERGSPLVPLVPAGERKIDLEAATRVVQDTGRRDLVLGRHALRAFEMPVGTARRLHFTGSRVSAAHTTSSSEIAILPWHDGMIRSRSPGSETGPPSRRSIVARRSTQR